MLVVPILAVFASGIIMSLQHGFNGTVAARAGSPLPGTLVNYILWAAVLLAVWLVKLALGGHGPVLPADGTAIYVQAVLGIAIVLAAMFLAALGPGG